MQFIKAFSILIFLLSCHFICAQATSELDQNSLEFSDGNTIKSFIKWDALTGDLLLENLQPTIPGNIEGDIWMKTTDDIFLNTGPSGISMGIYENGHVGIGEPSTARPEALLTLTQKSAISDSNSGLRIKNFSGSDSGRLWVKGNGNFSIQKGGNTDQLSLNAGGNIGIGAEALSNIKLRIEGKVRINGNGDGPVWTFGLNGSSIFRGPSKFVHNLAANHSNDPKIEGFKIENEGDNDHYVTIYVFNDNGEIGLFSDQGNGFQGQIGGFNASTGAYSSVSDSRLKNDVKTLPNIQDKIAALKPVQYVFNNDAAENIEFGFLAQELNHVFPEFVSYNEKQDLHFVNYAGLSTISIKGIQELQVENKILREKLEKIERQILEMKR